VEDLNCPNLGVAALLAIEPVVWQHASWQKWLGNCPNRWNISIFHGKIHENSMVI
jgi:hypothetical protein